jgi:two-component system OmpR family response regulator
VTGAADQDMPDPQLPCRVLVVDDEPDLADLAHDLLQHHGFAVSVAYGAAEALQLLGTDQAFDAVFSDIMMPGMSGLALAEMITLRYPHIRVVLTSGYAGPAASVHAYHAFIAKPYRITQVISLLAP